MQPVIQFFDWIVKKSLVKGVFSNFDGLTKSMGKNHKVLLNTFRVNKTTFSQTTIEKSLQLKLKQIH